MKQMYFLLLNLILQVFRVIGGAGVKFGSVQDNCSPARCHDSGPEIRFPFWLKDHQPERCGYPRPGSMLSCSPTTNTTELDFQYPVISSSGIRIPSQFKLTVTAINYKSHLLKGHITGVCLPNKIPATDSNVSSSETFPFKLDLEYSSGFTLFNCSSNANLSAVISRYGYIVNCLTGSSYQAVALDSNHSAVSEFIPPSCVKIYSVDSAVDAKYWDEHSILQWWEPSSCGSCEEAHGGNYCKPNATNQTQCVDHAGDQQSEQELYHPVVLVLVVVPLLVFLVLSILLYYIFSWKRRKDQEKKIEMFLDNYKALRPTRFTYTDIKEITERFKEKLGQGGYGTVYKGKLSDNVLVAVKVLKISKGNGDDFINEVGTIGKIHHVNVVRLVGYCSDGYNRALVYEFLPNDSLEKIISSRKKINEIGWHKLQEIAIGIAKGLDYLHQGCNQRILHFDIKPQNILLDHHFNPKVADFGLAKLCSKEQSVFFMTAARGTVGYIAPEIFSTNFGSVSYKSDVYSFGMLMLDMVGGRKRFQWAEDQNSSSEIYFPEWMYNQLQKGEQKDTQIDEEEDSEIFMRLAIVGLWCIQWYPTDRPSMKGVLQMLEGENMPTMPPNPFPS